MGFTRAYRAVSEEEFFDITASGRFHVGENSMEGKWFADSLESAIDHGKELYPDTTFKLVEADVPDDAPSLFKHPNIDNKGPGRYLAIEDLGDVVPRLVEV